MDRQLAVAVVGATGLVGETMVSVLEERGFPVAELFALASNRSLGRSVSFRGRRYPVDELAGFDFARCELALFCAGAAVARQHAARAVAAGCLVIDNSCEFRGEASVPLVIPEVNPQALERVGRSGLIASPNSTTIELLLTLEPLHEAAQLTRIHVATYEAVSGAGREAVEELARQSIAALSGKGAEAAHGAAKPLAFNCVPQVDAFEENGFTRGEMQLVSETRRILDEPRLPVSATAVRVPVFHGHSQVVHIETARPLSAPEARELLQNAPGVTVLDEHRPGGYPTAATEAANRDTVCVGRIREDLAPGRGLNLWIVADNLRKGAATNSVQIAETLVRRPI
ncbi:MAG TPA: aspartate-semialdehyde dehydrogenase [Steroidobacteraceae bacterium]|nr:aspartate-semialdehyde dehydrogenase [Steroidobacteraceae bacterium]